MRSNLSWAISGALLASAEAKALKWVDDSPGWMPPRETEAPKQIGFIPAAPEPTYMPTPNFDLVKRQTTGGNNTCGYINGLAVPASGIVCNTGWECYPDQRLKVMGCCSKGNNCVAETLCWNSVQSKSYSGDDGGRIRWCSDSRAPYCALGRFTSGPYSSYEVLFCDASSSRTYSLSYFQPQAITTPSSSSKSSTITTTSSTTSPTTTPTPSQTPVAAASASPAGAIAGGVVGGIAAIGIIVLGVIFLRRRKSRDDGPPAGGIIPGSTAYAAVSQYPPPQETGQNRTSLMKPPYRGSGSVSPYDPSLTGSALGSPSPGYPPQPYSSLPSPQPPVLPHIQPVYHQTQPYPQQYQPPPPQIYRPQQPNVAHELPVVRSDGELRELA